MCWLLFLLSHCYYHYHANEEFNSGVIYKTQFITTDRNKIYFSVIFALHLTVVNNTGNGDTYDGRS
jgi:hypothetical protein